MEWAGRRETAVVKGGATLGGLGLLPLWGVCLTSTRGGEPSFCVPLAFRGQMVKQYFWLWRSQCLGTYILKQMPHHKTFPFFSPEVLCWVGASDRYHHIPLLPSPSSSSCSCYWPGPSPSLWPPLHCLCGQRWTWSSCLICQKMSCSPEVHFPLVSWAASAQWDIYEALVLEDENQHSHMAKGAEGCLPAAGWEWGSGCQVLYNSSSNWDFPEELEGFVSVFVNGKHQCTTQHTIAIRK